MVSPLYKAKYSIIFSNYRPISLLLSFSKILEKLMSNGLLHFLNKCDILNKYQFVFRNNHSKYMALIILLEILNIALDKGECTIGIFLDFQKAFHTVNHGILLDKLYLYDICGPAYDCFSSYLKERPQFVVYNGCESEHKYIQCGVAQGSMLGPLLFFYSYSWFSVCCQSVCVYIVCRWYQLILYWSKYWFFSQWNKWRNVKSVFLGES